MAVHQPFTIRGEVPFEDQRAERLAKSLEELGIDPKKIPEEKPKILRSKVNNRGETSFETQRAELLAEMKGNSEPDQGNTVEEKLSFFAAQAEAVKSLRKAFKMDKEQGESGEAVKNWFSGNWMTVIIWVIALGIVWKILTPKKYPRRSHHKYDETGRMIY